ncbi:MAG TPA: rRNA adenine N-6-methyltransferase family protein [Methanoregulaceae archaeon]|nr:rRNA adenine N-6-methyltransferase family protein [Methanoregulaceae archaeon]
MIERGERILLIGGGRAFYVRAGAGSFSTDRGIIDLDMAVGASPGDVLQSHTGYEFVIRKPRPADYFAYSKRSGAPMLPKDIGIVIAYTGMNGNDEVLDAGTGSGIAAIYFGGVARKVVTYEKRPDFATLAEENIREAGLSNVEVIADDMLNATGMYDVVHLDMTLYRDHILHAHTLLRPGGYLACYTPFLEHMMTVLDTSGEIFGEVHAYEFIEREMTRSKRGTRPSTRVGHSGYITIARK